MLETILATTGATTLRIVEALKNLVSRRNIFKRCRKHCQAGKSTISLNQIWTT